MSILTGSKVHAAGPPFVSVLREARQRTGRSIASLFAEALRVRLGRNRLGLSEYFDFGLFSTDLALSEKLEFVGWRRWNQLEKLLIAAQWWAAFEDKITLYATLNGLGFPIPSTRAIYQRGRHLRSIQSLKSREDLRAYLVSPSTYPCFAKPNATGRGIGIAALKGVDVAQSQVILAGNEKAPLDALCSEIAEFFTGGYLFQEVLRQQDDLVARIGQTIGTVRLMSVATIKGPEIIAAAWRIPAGSSIVDNFSQGGNLLGGVSIEDGRVHRIVQQTGTVQTLIDDHPDTGMPLSGFRFPKWPEIVELCLDCTAAFPAIGLQAWDIAVTNKGPVIIEANIAGDIDVPQVANRRGIGDLRFEELIRPLLARP